MKRCLAIHDLSCVGKCSLTVALPVISSAGIECSVLPNSVLSTHTGGFAGYTFLDFSDEMQKILHHFEYLNLNIDAIYTGYIANINQIDLIKKFISKYNNSLIIVDPAMADNGKMYTGFNECFVEKMRELVKVSDVVIPNITETCLLLNEEYNESHGVKKIKIFAKKLCTIGPSISVITGVRKNNKIGVICYDSHNDRFYETYTNIVDGYYHGTGDLYSSAFVGAILNDLELNKSIKIAIELTYSSILKTWTDNLDKKYGVEFEYFLPKYSISIKRNKKNET